MVYQRLTVIQTAGIVCSAWYHIPDVFVAPLSLSHSLYAYQPYSVACVSQQPKPQECSVCTPNSLIPAHSVPIACLI